LRQGMVVSFDARVKMYRRSNNSVDYKLSYPTRLQLVTRG
jgi:hypothetical protein